MSKKNYGEDSCEWCLKPYVKNSYNQIYCKKLHKTNCYNCFSSYQFFGAPKWLKGSENKTIKYLCHSCAVSEGVKKSKITRIKKYNNSNYNNREKASKTMLERYNGSTTLESPTLREKVEKTMTEKFGNKSVKNSSVRLKNSASKRAKKQNISLEKSLFLSELFSNELFLEEWLHSKRKCFHSDKKFSYGELSLELGASVTELSHVFSRFPNLKKEYIKLEDSKLELIVVNFLEKDLSINSLCRRVKPISNFEIDIFLPENNLGFEVNDFATHSKDSDIEFSEFFKNKKKFKKGPLYHSSKSEAYRKTGVKIVFLWEDEVLDGRFRNIIVEELGIL